MSEWTVDTLHELFSKLRESDQKAISTALASAEKAVEAALTAAEKAVSKAEFASEKRFDSVNEFRAQLAELIATLMPRLETEQRLTEVDRRLSEVIVRVEQGQSFNAGSADNRSNRRLDTNQLVSVGSFLVALAAILYAALR